MDLIEILEDIQNSDEFKDTKWEYLDTKLSLEIDNQVSQNVSIILGWVNLNLTNFSKYEELKWFYEELEKFRILLQSDTQDSLEKTSMWNKMIANVWIVTKTSAKVLASIVQIFRWESWNIRQTVSDILAKTIVFKQLFQRISQEMTMFLDSNNLDWETSKLVKDMIYTLKIIDDSFKNSLSNEYDFFKESTVL